MGVSALARWRGEAAELVEEAVDQHQAGRVRALGVDRQDDEKSAVGGYIPVSGRAAEELHCRADLGLRSGFEGGGHHARAGVEEKLSAGARPAHCLCTIGGDPVLGARPGIGAHSDNRRASWRRSDSKGDWQSADLKMTCRPNRQDALRLPV